MWNGEEVEPVLYATPEYKVCTHMGLPLNPCSANKPKRTSIANTSSTEKSFYQP